MDQSYSEEDAALYRSFLAKMTPKARDAFLHACLLAGMSVEECTRMLAGGNAPEGAEGFSNQATSEVVGVLESVVRTINGAFDNVKKAKRGMTIVCVCVGISCGALIVTAFKAGEWMADNPRPSTQHQLFVDNALANLADKLKQTLDVQKQNCDQINKNERVLADAITNQNERLEALEGKQPSSPASTPVPAPAATP
jgi:hypothetical protein